MPSILVPPYPIDCVWASLATRVGFASDTNEFKFPLAGSNSKQVNQVNRVKQVKQVKQVNQVNEVNESYIYHELVGARFRLFFPRARV